MIPSARPTPKVMRASTASQMELAATGAVNEGSNTLSVALPSAVVSAIDDTANRSDPATEIRKGFGCMRTYATTSRIPRVNNPCSRCVVVCAAIAMPPMMPRMTDHRPWFASYPPDVPKTLEPYPQESLFSLLEAAAGRHPDRPAVAWFGKHMSYGQLLEEVEHCSAMLAALGVVRGDRVAMIVPNSPPYVIAYYAAQRL